jgi:hypothetical protein
MTHSEQRIVDMLKRDLSKFPILSSYIEAIEQGTYLAKGRELDNVGAVARAYIADLLNRSAA